MEQIAFYLLAAIALIASFGVIGQRSPMHSVMLLIVSFGAYAGLYVLLDAPFTAVTQIIIYAGAIMVLFLFVVMLLNAHTEDDVVPATIGPRTLKLGVLLSLALIAEVAYALLQIARTDFGVDPGTVSSIKDVGHIGSTLYTTYSFAFEVTSILILVSMVGAVVIAGKPRKER
jgi:NADH-quinone oxidoreductase subunit J